MPTISPPLARRLCLVSYALLLIFLLADSVLNPPNTETPLWLMLSVKLLPLLLVLPGLIKDSLRSMIWLCFIDLFYFTRAVVDVFLHPGTLLYWLPLLLSVLVFCSAIMYIKWEKAAGRTL